ncbi:hypothetical protein RN001_001498 [Aquatica leii]|uniref:Ribosome-binding protein 1 n=1 Tax=Aquatica leii TaxID=1421715 RepID=A0AAN7SJL2_9COLE|nr:hypothetical protein RN001_001498 [Aquatica leii]
MDIQSALIGVAVFLVSAGILLVISMFGMKEKSYEEALAEQRQQANTLLGVQHRTKPKDKKIKKTNKKTKEKQSNTESETPEEAEDIVSSSTTNAHQKLHVEFTEPTEQAVVSSDSQTPNKKEDVKCESVKEKSSKPKQNGIQEVKEKNVNKLRQNPVENKLKQQDITKEKLEATKEKQEITKEKIVKDKSNNSSPEVQKSKKAPENVFLELQVTSKEEPNVEVPIASSQTNGLVTNSTSNKEKKKKKAEQHLLQQLAAKDGDINLPLLLNVVRKAELSRSEVQILIDLLLNKQHEAPAVVDQWSEGKADPVQKLRKQLAEKEKALTEEQEALVGVQAKLREVRAEQTAEKVQLQQRNRGLEEALQAKHLELQNVNARLHSQNQKLQQMQAQINEETITVRKLREENAALQMQRQQIDMHISQAQEAEVTIQDLQSRNNQLTMELHSITEQNMATKEHQQSIIVQLQHQVNLYKTELDDKENYNRQIEEMRRDLEHRLGLSIRQENELKVEIGQLKSACQQNAEEVRRLEHAKGQALDEIRTLQKQKEELDFILTQVKTELKEVQSEKSELQQIKENGIAQENQVHKEELLNLHNELSSVKSQLQFVETKYAEDLDNSKKTVNDLKTELEEQKEKNNELRKKNWKVMEALKAAESKTSVKPTINVDEIVSKVRTEEQELHRAFIQRLFPDITISNDLPSDQWKNSVEKTIKKYISEVENLKLQGNEAEVSKLQAQVKHYKTIIDDTEGILKKLQNHIEQEEIHWRNELKTKESEIEALKQRHSAELQHKVEQLEAKLRLEESEKQKILDDYETAKNRTTAVVESFTEEISNLKEQIVIEQRKNLEKTNDFSVKDQTLNNSTNGPSIDAPAI